MRVNSAKGIFAALCFTFLASSATASKHGKVRLHASVHPELDLHDLTNLESNPSASLFYAQNSQSVSNETQLAAQLQAQFHYHTVILDHSAAIRTVVCQKNHLKISFNSQAAFTKAQKHWTKKSDLVFVSSKPGCHHKYQGQFGFFLASSVTFNPAALTATVTGEQVPITEVVAEYQVSWGDYVQPDQTSESVANNISKRVVNAAPPLPPAVPVASSPAAFPPIVVPCGVRPSVIPSGLSYLKKGFTCGNTFDKAVDDYLGYIGDDSNLDAALAHFAPGVSGLTIEAYEQSTGIPARKRDNVEKRGWLSDACDWVDDNIVKPVEHVVKEVVNDVKEVVQVLTEAAEEAVDAIKHALESVLPSWSPSVSFTIPVDMAAPSWMLDDSPWGDAYQIYSWAEGEGDVNYGINAASLAKLTGANELLVFDIDGVEQLPSPGVQVYCVDCGVTGSFKVTGSVTYTLVVGFTALTLDFTGNLQATLQLGLNAYAEYTDNIASIRLLTIPIDGFEIPEVITVGPAITFDVDATVEIDALGQVLAGATLTWDYMGAHIDLFDLFHTTGHGFAPQISPVFNVSGQVNATASVGIPVGFGIEIDILDGEWTKEIAVVDRPAIQAVASYSASNTGGSNDCQGISWYANFVNELKLELFDEDHEYDIGSWDGPAFLSGCVGDDGKSTVSQQQQPPAGDETLGGCKLVPDLITNNGFNVFDGNLVPPWSNYQSSGTNMFVEEDSFSDSGWSMAFYASNMDDTQTYSGTVLQPINPCTDAQYDVTFSARVVDCGTGICNLTSITVISDYDSTLNVGVYPNRYIPPNSNLMQTYGPVSLPIPVIGHLPVSPANSAIYQYDFNVPALNNAASAPMWLEITFTVSYTQSWEIRIDDIHAVPDNSDFSSKKRRSAGLEEGLSGSMMSIDAVAPPGLSRRGMDTPVMHAMARRDSASPSLISIPALPVITPINAAPTIPDFYDTAIPVQTAINAISPVSPNHAAPTIGYVPQPLPIGSLPPGANPTATASLLGPCNYEFPPRSVLMASATNGAGGALPTSGASTSSDGYTQLYDISGAVQLASAEDGNLYLSSYPANSPQTMFYSSGSVIVQDESRRSFHYYPDTISVYNVSRIRVADISDTPLTSQLITLVPVSTSAGNIYVAADTLGNTFLLAWCNAPDWSGSKVFLTRDYEDALSNLTSDKVQWVVTGDAVTMCYPLLLTSPAAPIA